MQWAFDMHAGADAIYGAASFDTLERMEKDCFSVIGNVGHVPHSYTRTGGFKGFGKTVDSAMGVWEHCKRYEDVRVKISSTAKFQWLF